VSVSGGGRYTIKESTTMKPRSMYVSFDVFETADGAHAIDYTQWDLSCAVKAYPVRTWTDPTTGEHHLRPETHDGSPLLSVMTREREQGRIRDLIEFVLGKL
jgi:hypothetical protein